MPKGNFDTLAEMPGIKDKADLMDILSDKMVRVDSLTDKDLLIVMTTLKEQTNELNTKEKALYNILRTECLNRIAEKKFNIDASEVAWQIKNYISEYHPTMERRAFAGEPNPPVITHHAQAAAAPKSELDWVLERRRRAIEGSKSDDPDQPSPQEAVVFLSEEDKKSLCAELKSSTPGERERFYEKEGWITTSTNLTTIINYSSELHPEFNKEQLKSWLLENRKAVQGVLDEVNRWNSNATPEQISELMTKHLKTQHLETTKDASLLSAAKVLSNAFAYSAREPEKPSATPPSELDQALARRRGGRE